MSTFFPPGTLQQIMRTRDTLPQRMMTGNFQKKKNVLFVNLHRRSQQEEFSWIPSLKISPLWYIKSQSTLLFSFVLSFNYLSFTITLSLCCNIVSVSENWSLSFSLFLFRHFSIQILFILWNWWSVTKKILLMHSAKLIFPINFSYVVFYINLTFSPFHCWIRYSLSFFCVFVHFSKTKMKKKERKFSELFSYLIRKKFCLPLALYRASGFKGNKMSLTSTKFYFYILDRLKLLLCWLCWLYEFKNSQDHRSLMSIRTQKLMRFFVKRTKSLFSARSPNSLVLSKTFLVNLLLKHRDKMNEMVLLYKRVISFTLVKLFSLFLDVLML
jgi:hypothetical protein